ncbi:trypsin-like peptidase domain-containing protein [Amycolatopsis silviterrae]|uniref:Trypsin-like peptidase domain-containing protein n=1 Tax=Amycolatopsis silviterrae TaxID=1656914 RepID=A0ABW5HK13_9PSEU
MQDERQRLESALRAATIPLSLDSGAVCGTGFFIGPGLVLTCAHVITTPDGPAETVYSEPTDAWPADRLEVMPGSYRPGGQDGEDLVLLQTSRSGCPGPALLSDVSAVGDDAWVFGYPEGRYRTGDVVSLRLEGRSERTDGAMLLKGSHGRIRPGMSGGPVLNWRTGAVCGIVRYRDRRYDDIARFVPVTTVFACYPGLPDLNLRTPSTRRWLDLLDDGHLAAGGMRYPGPRLRQYLRAASRADDTHPYAGLLDTRPPLSKVYLRQEASPETAVPGTTPETRERVPADDLFTSHPGVQIVGGPGAGKSSLARHLTAVTARRWLDDASGEFVPVLVPADALAKPGGLSELLAEGTVRMLDVELDRATLTRLFSGSPLHGARWMVLVDGVDEVLDPSLRRQVLAKIARHRADSEYRFALTSRPLPSYLMSEVTEDGQCPTYVIEPFARGQLGDFAATWFVQLGLPEPEAAAERFLARLEQTGLGDLVTIPLLATMACILYAEAPDERLPGNRGELYAQFIALLLTKRKLAEVRGRLRRWTEASGPDAVAAAESLLDRTRELLRRMAYEEYRLGTDPFTRASRVDPAVALSGYVGKPANMGAAEWASVAQEVLRSCGLFVEHRGTFTFIHQTVQEYLAAAYLAGRHPNPRSRHARKLVAPQEWPWRGLEVKLFLVALWAANGQDVTPVLIRLLSRRNREACYPFLVELHRQQVRLPAKVHAKLVDILTEWVTGSATDHAAWRDAANAALTVAPDRAISLLRHTSASPGNWRRRLDSALLLLDHDRPHGTHALRALALDENLEGFARLRAAQLLREHHPDAGTATLDAVARSGPADIFRTDAARLVGENDPARGQVLLTSIAYDAQAAGAARLDAAQRLPRTEAADALRWLAADDHADPETRFKAASALADWFEDRGPELLAKICRNPKLDRELRIRAAARVTEFSPAFGSRLQLELVADPSLGEKRVAVAATAAVHDPRNAATALAELARSANEHPKFRITAAEAAAGLDREVGVDVLTSLAADRWFEQRFAAILTLERFDRQRAAKQLQRIADHPSEPLRLRLDAVDVLWDLDPDAARPKLLTIFSALILPDNRPFDLIERVGAVDPGLAARLLSALSLSHRLPADYRLRAADRLRRYDRHQAAKVQARLANDPVVMAYREAH